MLKFDKKGLANEIINKLEIELQSAFTEWKKYAMERNNGKFYENFADAEADFALKRYSEGIIATLKANPYMLASSYGTGSLMLDDNPLLQEYKNSDRWNPLRKGKSIVGRKSGTYVNAFGETRKTSGAFAGINIEGRSYDMRDGNLILRGIVNPDTKTDTSTYITGGVYTKYKRPFHNGRIEVKAKLQCATGAWPAIWLKPFEEEKYPWPSGGEIDIMEHLNYDSIVYQTVHSNYTQIQNMKEYPKHGITAPINRDDYNVYAVEMYPDSVVFFVNNQHTHTYPRINPAKEGQFPFDKPYYLLIDMQLGGNWVGKINPEDLPVEMQIDWVRYYKLNPEFQPDK